MRRPLKRIGLLTVVFGSGFLGGWAAFGWQPWIGHTESFTARAELQLIKAGYGREAHCVQRRYPANVADCAVYKDSSGACFSANYTAEGFVDGTWTLEQSRDRQHIAIPNFYSDCQ